MNERERFQLIAKDAEKFAEFCKTMYMGMFVMGLSQSQVLAYISTKMGVNEATASEIYKAVEQII